MSEQVTQLKAERDETMRQLQLARANEAQLSDCLQELKNAGTEESGSKEVAELEQVSERSFIHFIVCPCSFVYATYKIKLITN